MNSQNEFYETLMFDNKKPWIVELQNVLSLKPFLFGMHKKAFYVGVYRDNTNNIQENHATNNRVKKCQ